MYHRTFRRTLGCLLLCLGSAACAADPERGDATRSDAGALDSGPADGGQTGDPAPCPEGRGPAMVRVPTPDGDSYCIDRTEVTLLQYEAFLDDGAPAPSAPEACNGNDEFDSRAPGCDPSYVVTPDHPVTCIDWCDAHAFCAWAGKRLCGAMGRGSGDVVAPDDAARDEWFNACSGGGATEYAYGDAFDELACRVPGDRGVISSVRSFEGCEGGFDGLFDFGGNAAEWLETCEGDRSPTGECLVAGDTGATNRDAGVDAAERHRCAARLSAPRQTRSQTIGVRCCAP